MLSLTPTFYFISFIISVILVMLFTLVVGSLAIRFNAIDSPSGRKIHRRSIPLWGGVAVFASVFGTLLILKWIYPAFGNVLNGNSGYVMRLLEGIIAGAIIITAIGIVDDLRGVSAITKLLGQIIAAMVVVQYGIRIEAVKIPFFEVWLEFPLYLVIVVTVFWIVGFINSINLIDGIDGLAAGITAIATLIFFVISLHQISVQTDPVIISRLKLASVLSLVVCASCVGFLKFNFPPAKIFLGDSGSLLLGYFAGVITICGILKTAAAFTLIIPVIIFGVPILDTFFSMVRRLFRGQSIVHPDRDHLHHRLFYKRGWNTRKVVLMMYSITFCLGLIAIFIVVL